MLSCTHMLHDIEGEGADLLDSVDGNLVLKASVSPLFQQVVVDFPGAKQNLKWTIFYVIELMSWLTDLFDGGWVVGGRPLVQDHSLELSVGQQVVKR